MENEKLIEALKATKQYFVDGDMMNVRKLAMLLMKIDSALASVGAL